MADYLIPVWNEYDAIPVDVAPAVTETYKVNFDMTPATGHIDGLAALKQSIFCALLTERFWFEIYSFDYGIEIVEKIGKIPDDWIRLQIQKSICECLEQDDRITDVYDFSFERNKNDVLCRFRVDSTVGAINIMADWWGDTLRVTYI